MMDYIATDILDNECIINLVHHSGVTMESLNDRIIDRYPFIYDNYMLEVHRNLYRGTENLLGHTQIIKAESFKYIINIFCIDDNGINLEYLEKGLMRLKQRSYRFYHFEEICIEIPKNNKDMDDLIMKLFRHDKDITISVYRV